MDFKIIWSDAVVVERGCDSSLFSNRFCRVLKNALISRVHSLYLLVTITFNRLLQS